MPQVQNEELSKSKELIKRIQLKNKQLREKLGVPEGYRVNDRDFDEILRDFKE